MAEYSVVKLDHKRIFNITDLNFKIRAKVEMTNITLSSKTDRSFYVDITTNPLGAGDHESSGIIGLGTRVEFDESIKELFDSPILTSTLFRVDCFFHSNTVSNTTQTIGIRLVQYSTD